jgi:hypothetical protein
MKWIGLNLCDHYRHTSPKRYTWCGCEVHGMVYREPYRLSIVETCLCTSQLVPVMISMH